MSDIESERQTSSAWGNALRYFVFVVAAIFLLLAIAVVTLFSFSKSSTSGTMASGRTIKTTVRSLFLESTVGGDTATIKACGKTVVVKGDIVSVNGKFHTNLDPNSQSINLDISRREVVVKEK